MLASNQNSHMTLEIEADSRINQHSPIKMSDSSKISDSQTAYEEIASIYELSKWQINSSQCNYLRVLDLSKNNLGWKEIEQMSVNGDSLKNLQVLDLSQNCIQDKGVWILWHQAGTWKSLENLNLAESHLGKLGAKCLNSNLTFKALKQLNLSRNEIGNLGAKYLGENSSWTKLEVLLVSHISLGFEGLKSLALNESWKNLKELDLQGNPKIGNSGALELSYNKRWKNLDKIKLSDSGVGNLGVDSLRRRKFCKVDSLENGELLLCKQFNSSCFQIPAKSDRKHSIESKIFENFLPSVELCKIRGGGRSKSKNESNKQEASPLHGLLEKIDLYKRRIQDDLSLQNEFSLYIEPLGKYSSLDRTHVDIEPFELEPEIKKSFLSPDSHCRALLLTGGGNSLFCRYLQRRILFDWVGPSQASEERAWLPIYIDLLKLKTSIPSSSLSTTMITEILKKELDLTESDIIFFKENQLSPLLPRLLFIFDEYDQIIQENRGFLTATDCIRNNFCRQIGIEGDWENSNVIITCRKRALQNVSHRHLLFGHLNHSLGSLIPGSFIELEAQAFDCSQILSYLKKYTIINSHQIPNLELDGTEEIISSVSGSWSLARRLEGVLASNGLTAYFRTPFDLFMAVKLLPQLEKENRNQKRKEISEQETTVDKDDTDLHPSKESQEEEGEDSQIDVPNQHKPFRLYELFADQAIQITVEKLLAKTSPQAQQTQDSLIKKIKRQLQILALRASNYTLDPKELEIHQKDIEEDSLLTDCSLLISKNGETPVFLHKIFQEFFVANYIVEELNNQGSTEDSKELIFAQKSLVDDLSRGEILLFLAFTVHQQLLPDTLINLIQKSKKSIELPPNTQEKANQMNSEAPAPQGLREQSGPNSLSIAAANAITVLNLSGYNFSQMDFSGVCIANADLSNGKFEGTNFTGADLQGVNFTNAHLAGGKLTKANLSEVQFGENVTSLPLDQEGFCMVNSPDGESIIIGMRGEVSVLEKSPGRQFHYREARILKGHIGDILSCAFSPDGKRIITGGEDRTVRFWDFETGECIKILRDHTSSVIGCAFSQDGKQIISIEKDKIIKKWALSEAGWISSLQLEVENITNCGFVPGNNNLIFAGGKDPNLALYDSADGRYIRKFGHVYDLSEANSCRLSASGIQMVVGIEGMFDMLDVVRNHPIKNFEHLLDEDDEIVQGEDTQTMNFSLSRFATYVASTRNSSIKIQDTADGEYVLKNSGYKIKSHLMDPFDPNLLTILLDKKVISFWDSNAVGGERTLLDWDGTNIDDATGLSEENVMVFFQKGDYTALGKEEIQELVLNGTDPETITKIDLSKRNSSPHLAHIIGRSSKWRNLERLDLSSNNILDEGALQIAKNLTWPNLQELILTSTQISNDSCSEIANNISWMKLRRLDLSTNSIGKLGAEVLSMNKTWDNLEELDLSDNKLGIEGAIALSSNSSWKQLKKLDLSINGIGDKGAEAVAKNAVWTELEELGLSDNSIGDLGAAMIGSNTSWPNLKILSLESNHINDIGAAIISKNTSWINLEELYLFKNGISEEFSIEHEADKSWSKLKWVIWKIENPSLRSSLVRVKICEIVAQGLKDSDAIIIGKKTKWRLLEELDLRENEIGDKGAVEIGKTTKWSQLRIFSLYQNKIGAEGATAIASNTTWTNLEEFWLHGNSIGDAGAVQIGKNTTWSKLKMLSLDSNKIGDAGAVAIGSNRTWANLEDFQIHINEISDRGAIAIGKNELWCKLRILSLSQNKIGE